jgi:hypothetical protein
MFSLSQLQNLQLTAQSQYLALDDIKKLGPISMFALSFSKASKSYSQQYMFSLSPLQNLVYGHMFSLLLFSLLKYISKPIVLVG